MESLLRKLSPSSAIRFIDFYDPDHSVDEHRYLIMGQSTAGRVLLISYTERDKIVRLISARELTPSERRDYEEG